MQDIACLVVEATGRYERALVDAKTRQLSEEVEAWRARRHTSTMKVSPAIATSSQIMILASSFK